MIAALRTDPRCDAALRHSLVQSLYASPGTIVAGIVCGAVVACTIAGATGKILFWGIAVLFLLHGIGRAFTVYRFWRAGLGQAAWSPHLSLHRWEQLYDWGGALYGLLLGLLGYATLTLQDNRLLDLFALAMAVGYCGSVASRNAARPELANAQIILVTLPLATALVQRGSPAEHVLALLLLLMAASVAGIVRHLHRQYVDALIGARENARLAYTFEQLSRTDQLTGLINRGTFENRVGDALDRGEPLALLWLDLDRFKEINEALGHVTGDELLCAVGRRLLAALPPQAVASRFAADEFIVMVPGDNADQAVAIASGLRVALAAPFDLAHHRLPVSVSIGVTVAPQDGQDARTLLQHSDLALSHAKTHGMGIARFTPTLKQALDRSRQIEQRLRVAIAVEGLALVYQPIFELDTGRMTACEALLRWTDSQLGVVSPAEFIPVAEATGLIEPMTRWVLARACADARPWAGDIKVAVNVSPQLFRSGMLSDAVMGALLDSGLPATRLEIEVTESLFLARDAQIDALLQSLRAAGVRLSLDDFGTGYSSLAYLSRFRFDKIKLDGSFLRSAGRLREERAVAAAVTLLARELEMETVAEGIETPAQRAFAAAIGFSHGQGFGLAVPQPADALGNIIADGIGPAAAPVRRAPPVLRALPRSA